MKKENKQAAEIPQKLDKETELPENVDYRGIGGHASLNQEVEEQADKKEKQEDKK